MVFDLAIIGCGVIGVETLHEIRKTLSKNKKSKKIKIAIIERNLDNIPGGVAYSVKNSKFGFFNNPLRLSHPDFIKWFNLYKNKKKILEFSKKKKNYNLVNWAKNNNFILKAKFKDYDEIYLPRLIYAFFLEEKLIEFLNNKKKLKISVNFLKGEVKNLNRDNIYKIYPKTIFNKFNINFKKKCLFKEKTLIKIDKIKTKKIIIGTGIVPPKKINEIGKKINSNYIWDFYSSGGTFNLLKKIHKITKIKRNIKLVFIGNKAGLLETMQEIENLIKLKKNNIKIICISKNSLTLQKAERSKKFDLFKFKYLIKKKIKQIKKSDHILNLITKEFKQAKLDGFNKYDVWTKTLKNKIMNICYQQLSESERKNYNLNIFPKIRNMTRYTYPETVNAKNRLQKNKVISFLKDKVISIIKKDNFIILETKNNKKLNCDLVVNVSGPVSIIDNKNEIEFINSLKKISKKFNERGFSTNNNFMLERDIYLPGTLSNNFNPGRETIIKAITKNAHKVAKNIFAL